MIKEAAMRKILPRVVVAALLIATAVDVVAAGLKNITAKNHPYYAAPSGITVAVPVSMERLFDRAILPQ